MESSDIAKRAIGFVILLAIIGVGRFTGCDKSSKRSMIRVLKESDTINQDAQNRMQQLLGREDDRALQDLHNLTLDWARRLEDVRLSGCPSKFKTHYQTLLRVAQDQANLISQYVELLKEADNETLPPHKKMELGGKILEMQARLSLSDRRFLAANVQLWDYAKSCGANARYDIPSEVSREEMRNMDLSENLADQEPSNVRVTVSSDASDDAPAASPASSKPRERAAPSGNADNVQAVYTAMQRRLTTLVSKGSDSTVKGEERKTVTGKIRDYTTKALESDLPGDLRKILAQIDQKLVAYDKLQDLQIEAESSFFEDKDPDVEHQEEDLLDEIKTLWKEINAIAEDYGCETVEL